MTAEEVGGVVRTLAAAGFGALVGSGWLSAEMALQLSGAVGVLAVGLWSIWQKRKAG